MRIAIFASQFYPHIGGVEELCRQLAREYMRRGLGVIVVTNRWPRSLPDHEVCDGVPVYRLAMRIPEGSWKARVNYRLTHHCIVRQMHAILRQSRTNLIHVQCVSANGYYASLAKRQLGLPLVVSAQGERTMDATALYSRSPFMNRVLHDLLNSADVVTACSGDTLSDLERYHGESFGERGRVIHNGIRVADFDVPLRGGHETGQSPFILAIGRLVAQKGFDVLLQAFAKLSLRTLDLLIAGDGPERTVLEKLARDLGISDRVRFVGRADRDLTVSLFQRCAFFVLPSRMEPFGIVNLEAMAARKAVIASAVGGVPEIVRHRVTGLLVEPENPEALAAAIARLAEDKGLRDRLGAAGRDAVGPFDWAVIADKYLATYSRALGVGQTAVA